LATGVKVGLQISTVETWLHNSRESRLVAAGNVRPDTARLLVRNWPEYNAAPVRRHLLTMKALFGMALRQGPCRRKPAVCDRAGAMEKRSAGFGARSISVLTRSRRQSAPPVTLVVRGVVGIS
jgi:hypothetical protein